MRTKRHKALIMGLMFLILPHIACPQNMDVSSSLNMGFGVSQAANNRITTVAGEGLSGSSEGENTRLIGGFIAVVHQSRIPVGVEELAELPSAFALQQNYPNPFNPSTRIAYGIPEQSWVRMVVYDIRGRIVTILVNEVRIAGWYTVEWHGIDDSGFKVGSGLYFARLQVGDPVTGGAGNFSKTIKMVYLR